MPCDVFICQLTLSGLKTLQAYFREIQRHNKVVQNSSLNQKTFYKTESAGSIMISVNSYRCVPIVILTYVIITYNTGAIV